MFLILDNLPRPSFEAGERLGSPSARIGIEVFYLPSYAPELNPDERLNADMKHAIEAKVPVRTKPKLKAAAEDHMTMIGKSPDRVGLTQRPKSEVCGVETSQGRINETGAR